MKELKIGEEYRIRCVEDKGQNCSRCVVNLYGGDCGPVKCWAEEREDGKDVYFELVED